MNKREKFLGLLKLGFFMVCVAFTIGLILVTMEYFVGNANGIDLIQDSIEDVCNGRGFIACEIKKVVIFLLRSGFWPLIIVAVIGTIGAIRITRKIEWGKKNKN